MVSLWGQADIHMPNTKSPNPKTWLAFVWTDPLLKWVWTYITGPHPLLKVRGLTRGGDAMWGDALLPCVSASTIESNFITQ